MTTGTILFGTHEACLGHDTGRGHPERASRMGAVLAGIDASGVAEAVTTYVPRPARREELVAVHGAEYVDAIEAFCAAGGPLDADTITSAESWQAALIAAGAGVDAVERLRAGEGDAAFVAVRPPGHHATPRRAMGFCLLNNVAITAAALADAGERVLIVDFDAHHGNGTQDAFYRDERVTYISLHEWPLYPGTGWVDETGAGAGTGSTVNIPVPEGATGDVFLAGMSRVVGPVAARVRPTWLLVSAGFDGHAADPLTGLALSSGDYALIVEELRALVPAGRLLVMLEGGYDLDALTASTAATLAALAGERLQPEAPTHGGPGLDMVDKVAALHASAPEPAGDDARGGGGAPGRRAAGRVAAAGEGAGGPGSPGGRTFANGAFPRAVAQGRGDDADTSVVFDLSLLLAHVADVGGSDLHIKAGSPPRVRVNGELKPAPFPAVPSTEIEETLRVVMPVDRIEEFHRTGEADFSMSIPNLGRFRGNAFRQRGSAAMVLRRVLPSALSVVDLGLPPIVTRLAEEHRGMVLVTGPTGSGKTTTLAAMIDHINQTRAANIITIEDPIEVIHPDKRSIISQREIGNDTRDYAQAMRRVLRQDPDVILIGEMRDAETVGAALTAAETGHLVLSTLHTTNATETVNRVVDFFPPFQQQQIRLTLAGVLKGVISQRLVARADGEGRVPAIEAMVVTGRISDRIVDPTGQAETIEELIADGEYHGMQTFDQSLFGLFKSGDVSLRAALAAATNPHDFRLALQNAGLLGAS